MYNINSKGYIETEDFYGMFSKENPTVYIDGNVNVTQMAWMMSEIIKTHGLEPISKVEIQED